jgi:hypothetical protein
MLFDRVKLLSNRALFWSHAIAQGWLPSGTVYFLPYATYDSIKLTPRYAECQLSMMWVD